MTYNEEANIERCLASVQGVGDEIFVLDSYSTDHTVDIALGMGARVEQISFDTYVNQRSRLIQMAQSDWVLILDADEYVSDELKLSIRNARKDLGKDGYTLNRRNKIGNKWIGYGSWYPDRKIRLFNRRKVSISGRDPHDVMIPLEGAHIGHLSGDIMHLSDDDISSRYHTINKHSERAAQSLFEEGRSWSLWRMMLKPGIRFFISYVIRFGFLDGYYGWFIAKSEGQYVWLREIKLYEKWQNKKKVNGAKA